MSDDVSYEAPEITEVTEIGEPLIGSPVGSVPNPQWNDEADGS